MISKKPTAVPSVSAELEEVRRRLQEWRRKRRRGSRIPEALLESRSKTGEEASTREGRARAWDRLLLPQETPRFREGEQRESAASQGCPCRVAPFRAGS